VNIDTSLPPSLSAYAATKRRFADRARELSVAGGSRMLNIALESVSVRVMTRPSSRRPCCTPFNGTNQAFALSPGGQTRDYVFVDDAVTAILLLLDHAHRTPDRYLAAGVGGARASRSVASPSWRGISQVARHGSIFGAMPYRAGELMDARADTSLLTIA